MADMDDGFRPRPSVRDFGGKNFDDCRRRSGDRCKIEYVASRESRRAVADYLDDDLLERLESDLAASLPSTDLMKWACPRMKFVAFGLSLRIVWSGMAVSLRPR
jgi:hypothetical protein